MGANMGLWELFVIAVGLSMDAFAVSICKGLSVQKLSLRHAFCAGAYFGGFQALMPLIGFLVGVRFQGLIAGVDHWIAFVLLSYLGGKMVYESFKEEDSHLITFSSRMLFTLGVATSIDALAVGVSMAFLKTGIWFPASVIAFTTFFLSFSGVICGFRFGKIKGLKVELLGGLILIVIGVKILIEHTLLD